LNRLKRRRQFFASFEARHTIVPAALLLMSECIEMEVKQFLSTNLASLIALDKLKWQVAK
jgi:hypothetical protein